MFSIRLFLLALTATAVLASPLAAQTPPSAAPRGARTIVYHPRDLVSLKAKLHYTTLIAVSYTHLTLPTSDLV